MDLQSKDGEGEDTNPQRRAFAESGAANAVFLHDPSREKAILENPQIFQNCEIINILSADDAQSNAERIPNRLALLYLSYLY